MRFEKLYYAPIEAEDHLTDSIVSVGWMLCSDEVDGERLDEDIWFEDEDNPDITVDDLKSYALVKYGTKEMVHMERCEADGFY